MKKPEKPTETLKGSWHQTDPLLPPVGIENWETSSSSWQGPTAAKPFTPSAQDAVAAPGNRINGRDAARQHARFFNLLLGVNLGARKAKEAGCGCSAFGTPCSCPLLFWQRDGRRIKRTLIKTQEQSQTGSFTIVKATTSEAKAWEDARGRSAGPQSDGKCPQAPPRAFPARWNDVPG